MKLIRILSIMAMILVFCAIEASIITLEEARNIALENNPGLLAEMHGQKSAAWDKWNAAFAILPSASLNGSHTEYNPDFMNSGELRSYGVTVNQPLFNGGSILLGYLMKNDQSKIARESFLNSYLVTLAEVDSKYFSVLESRSLLENATKDLQASIMHLEIVQSRYEAGTLSKADLLQMQSQKAVKEVTLIQMDNLNQISRSDFANFLRIPIDFQLETIPLETHEEFLNLILDLSIQQIELYIDYVTALGTEQNPLLQISRLSTKISKKSLLLAGGRFLPSLNLSWSRTWDKYDYQEDFEDSERLMLIASVPIFPLVDNFSSVSKARHDLKRSQYEMTVAEDGIKLGLRSAVLNLVTAAKTTKAARIALEFAQETYDQMEERFQNNLNSTSDLLDVEILLASAENQYVTSFYDFLRAKTSLKQQVGITDEDQVFNINIFEYLEEK